TSQLMGNVDDQPSAERPDHHLHRDPSRFLHPDRRSLPRLTQRQKGPRLPLRVGRSRIFHLRPSAYGRPLAVAGGVMTYDQWKTTNPRDYEPEEEQEPSELELVY